MRKLFIVFLLFIFLYIGIFLGQDNTRSKFNVTQEELNKFEDYLEDSGSKQESIEPNILNELGQKIESIIEKGFDVFFELLK